MKTYILEGVVTALSSISHSGGERNGTVIQLRREKFVQMNGETVEIPVVSGNGIRGKLRDISAMQMLTDANGEKVKVDANIFNLLFSGGTLESTGTNGVDVNKFRKLRKQMPMLSVLGGSIGNVILPGKVEIGKLIPISKETIHLIPTEYRDAYGEEPKSIWEYLQLEMYTRKDDVKDENKREYMEAPEENTIKSQMKYDYETIAAGTKFYWRICLKDTTDKETGAFLSTLSEWAKQTSQVGGNGRVGHGAVSLNIKETKILKSKVDFQNSNFVKFLDDYNKEGKKEVSDFIKSELEKVL